MHPTDPGTLALAVIAALGLIAAIAGWFFRRGADEREMTVALKDNTMATNRLTEKVEGVVDTLHSHDIRITRLEALQNGSAPAHRNPSPSRGH